MKLHGIGAAKAVLVGLMVAMMAGCDNGNSDGGGGNGGGGGASVVGKWLMVSGESGSTGYWEFFANGDFTMFDDAGYTVAHASGTFTQSGAHVTGTFENPGVGDGEIDCTLSADSQAIEMDFIEHWHDPYKHVPFTGTKN